MRRLPLRSPPRMRGKVTQSVEVLTNAGKSLPARRGSLLRRDHPRVCGEKNGICRAKVPHLGSPPRMRGKVHCPRSRLGRTRDHPRVCGEKMNQSSSHRWVTGSPPRMRGKVSGQKLWMVLCGITPAYAGKRASQLCAGLAPRDHPRVCGEKAYSLVMSGSLWGSPPRMRGKVPQPGVEGCRLGITPACAGKRRTGPAVRDRSWDHPRVCGEKGKQLVK